MPYAVIDGLAALESVRAASIVGNDALVDVSVLARVALTASEVNVWDNTALTDLMALADLRSISWLAVGGNALTTYDDLAALESADDLILGEAGVADLRGLSNVTRVERLTARCRYSLSCIATTGDTRAASTAGYSVESTLTTRIVVMPKA